MAKICARSTIVRYYKQPKNLGLSENLSWVLAQPQTDLVVRLDSDDRLEPEYVERSWLPLWRGIPKPALRIQRYLK